MNCNNYVVGITTTPFRERHAWESMCRVKNWQILNVYDTKEQAQAAEDMYAPVYDCKMRSESSGPEHARWCVYKFEYVKVAPLSSLALPFLSKLLSYSLLAEIAEIALQEAFSNWGED